MHIHVKDELQRMKKKNSTPLDLSGTGYCASFNFRRTARAVTSLYDTALQKSGIRSTQFAILVGVAKNQPVSIGALANVLVIDGTTLTRSLRLLQTEGFIAISNRAAMRQRFLTVTAKGERVLARSLPAWRNAQERFVATIGANYWLDLRNDLEKLAHVAVDLEKPQREVPDREAIGS
ncbi:MAG: MarR family transcriptional regulator [Acidobacteria bacterium]|nr:MAG: MarR family transcriptional regulator [Acidobacteriota bacterium]PYT60943.1 MAG: MarR family transcriptional regulator [Acidobacteriota bacterium]